MNASIARFNVSEILDFENYCIIEASMTENNMILQNPVIRLSEVLEKISIIAKQNFSKNGMTKYLSLGHSAHLVINNLEVDPSPISSVDEQMGYMSLISMCDNAWKFVYHNSGERGRSVNLNHIDEIYSFIRQSSYNEAAYRVFGERIDESRMTNLYALAENLRAYGADSIISSDKISEISALIDELINIISESQLSEFAKSKLISALYNLRSSLVRVNFIGNDALIQELDIFLGRMVTTLPPESTQGSPRQTQTILDKASNLANTIDKAVSIYNKVYPLAQGAAILVGITLPKLPS